MKKNFFKKLLAVVTVVMTCLVMSVTAFASNGGGGNTTTADFSVTLGVTDTSKADKVFSDEGTGLPGLTYSSGTLTWDGGIEMSGLTSAEQKKAMAKYNEKVASAGLSSKATNQISDMLAETADGATVDMEMLLLVQVFDETKGDMVGGMAVIAPFLPYVNIVIGVIAILLVSLLVLSTLIDLACIGLPAVREAMLNKASDGSGDSAKKPKAVTYAAWATINDVEGNGSDNKGSGKNAYLTYFKKRLFDYIILGICLSFLVFGGFSGIMEAFLEIGKSFSGS